MKLLNLALIASVVGLSCTIQGQAQNSFPVEKMWVSGNGTRVVAEVSEDSPVDRLIRVYDARSRKQLGEFTRASRFHSATPLDNFPHYNREGLKVIAISADGHHLLLRRLPMLTDKTRQDIENSLYNPGDYAFFEAWNITKKPRLEWRRKFQGDYLLDVKWIFHKIIILTGRDVQQWNELGETQNKVALPNFVINGAISSDGTLAVVDGDNPVLINIQTAKVFRKLNSHDYLFYSGFAIGFKSQFIYVNTATPTVEEGGTVPSEGQEIYDVNNKKWLDTRASALFSPDGRALWDDDAHLFRTITTHQPAALATPKLFVGQDARLQALSGDGHVWAGINNRSEPIWTVTP